MANRPPLVVLLIMSGVSLSACGQKGGNDTPVNDPFSARSSSKEDQFGKGFGEASRAAPNSEPANVVDGDVIPVSSTAEPIELN